MANQNIQLKDQSGNLLFPRTQWKDIIDAPSTLPNPYALVINGKLYDGSTKVELTVEGGEGTTYTAGAGLKLTNTVFSVNTGTGLKISSNQLAIDETVVQYKLTAGTGIKISNNTISLDSAVIQPRLVNGTGTIISSDHTAINIDFTTVQSKLKAGTNITIDETTNTISASGGTSIDLVQSIGSSTTKVMSQNAVSTELTRLEQLIEDYHYVPISVSSLSASPSSTEHGGIVTSIIFNWSTSGAAAIAATLAGQDVLNKTSLTYSTSITDTTTYTLSVTDARAHTATRNVTIPFYWRVHWGTSASTTGLDSSFVLGLSNSTLSNTRTRTINVMAATGEYIYYAIPTSYGTPIFNVGGFDGGFSAVASFTHTNQYNQTVPFTLYRSDNSGLGTQTVKIS